MNTPPVFELLLQHAEVHNLISNADGTLRAFEFGFAEEDPQLPYVVWQNLSGSPDNNIDDRPNGDQILVQFDVYGVTAATVKTLAAAVRYAVELDCNITSYRNVDQDPETSEYHIGFDVLWLLSR